jgi:hypothetical protein
VIGFTTQWAKGQRATRCYNLDFLPELTILRTQNAKTIYAAENSEGLLNIVLCDCRWFNVCGCRPGVNHNSPETRRLAPNDCQRHKYACTRTSVRAADRAESTT